jgi:hypothetical protein
MQQPTNLTQRPLIYCLIGAVLCILFSCKPQENKKSLRAALAEIYPLDTAKEHFMLDLGAKLLDSIIYNIKDDADHIENQKVIDRLLDNINIPDSVLGKKFIYVKTKRDTNLIRDRGKLHILRGVDVVASGITKIHKNDVYMEFDSYCVGYFETDSVNRNGNIYTKGIYLDIHTKPSVSNLRVLTEIYMLIE